MKFNTQESSIAGQLKVEDVVMNNNLSFKEKRQCRPLFLRFQDVFYFVSIIVSLLGYVMLNVLFFFLGQKH